jgi:hypothetical protein
MLGTLPLSGRQEAWDGLAENWWRPVHSRGLFEGGLSMLQRSVQALNK